jgi:serine/threonine protein kinase
MADGDAPRPMTLPVGTTFGPYELLSPIGAGGMGQVYRARDGRLKRDVAVKVLPLSSTADSSCFKRFEQEAIAAGSLNHPNVLVIHDVGTRAGAPYIVSELLEGETLHSELAVGSLSTRRAVGYAVQIARGLAAAHERGIVHRDLKPENLFVTRDGRVKILDFGLAKLTHAGEDWSTEKSVTATTSDTAPGAILGTLGYISPEQLRGKPADARSDIFSFGAILYEMVTGKRAFRGDSAADTLAAILREDPPDLSLRNDTMSAGLDRIARHCLEKNPERRFQSAFDLAFDLEGLSETSARPVDGSCATRSSDSEGRFLAAAGAVFAVALALAAGYLARGE